jgi:cell division protein YceG involved in septum cleavage
MSFYQTILRASVGLLITISIVATFGLVLILQSKSHIYSYAVKQANPPEVVVPFPVGVDKESKIITEILEVETFFSDSLAQAPSSRNNWWNKVATFFAEDTWYQNLASPVGRIMVIWPGNRKEEVVKHVGDILRWSNEDRVTFLELMDDTLPDFQEGFYLPGQYVSHRYATPGDIHELLTESFQREVLDRYTPEVQAKVPFTDALIIASLIEREASDFDNMREVSGVIWNRLFIDMPLQLDATLQYIKANDPYQPAWWPAVRPPDKFLTSPYNTYQHAGLPPGPIANPSIEAILAALNPIQTDCLFYFHTRNGAYHCSPTYQEHVSKLRALYGRGS